MKCIVVFHSTRLIQKIHNCTRVIFVVFEVMFDVKPDVIMQTARLLFEKISNIRIARICKKNHYDSEF